MIIFPVCGYTARGKVMFEIVLFLIAILMIVVMWPFLWRLAVGIFMILLAVICVALVAVVLSGG
jgi:hypothetical protein